MKINLCDDIRTYDWNLTWFISPIVIFLIRNQRGKAEEQQLLNGLKEHDFRRHQDEKKWVLYDWVFFWMCDLSYVSSYNLSIAHRLKKFPDEYWKWIKKKRKVNWTELKYWISLRRGMTPNFSFSNLNWKFLDLKLRSLSDERSNISIVLCCTFHVEINHSFYQLQMMMKMIMNAIVENGSIFFKGVCSGTRKKVKERWNSDSYSLKNEHLYGKKKRVVSSKNLRFILYNVNLNILLDKH